MNWFRKRSTEASTYAGLAMVAYGLGEAFKIKELAPAAEAIGSAGQAVAGGTPWWMATGMAVLGGFAAIKSDGDKGF
jgi:hypothetical protein